MTEELKIAQETALVEFIDIKNANAVSIFDGNGLNPILEDIEKKARSVILDPSTDKGREEIRSVAYKIKRSRTALFDLAKNLTEDWREKTKQVNAERNRMEDFLKKLEEDIRSPLTEFENREKNRIAVHNNDIASIENLKVFENDPSIPEMEQRLEHLKRFHNKDWEEFKFRADLALKTTADFLTAKVEAKKKYEAEQAELERLRKAEADRLQKEREERLKTEAAEKAKREAEEKAEKEKAVIEAEKKAAEERAAKAEADRIAAETKASADAEKAEKDRLEAAERAEKEKKAAEERATQAEKDRQLAAKAAEDQAAAAREADKAHRSKINNESLVKLLEVLAGDNLLTAEAAAKAVITAIAKNQIPHISIKY